jgi:phage gpG-like protein
MIKVQFSIPDLEGKLNRMMPRIMGTIAATAQTNRGMLFDAEGAHNGHPKWASLKMRVGMILSDRGVLRKSIAPNNDGLNPVKGPDGIVEIGSREVVIGTRLFYAAMMNDGTTKMPGGVLRPVRAEALKIPLPSGKSATEDAKQLRKRASGKGKEKFIFRKSVKIPARPFDQWNTNDQAEMTETLARQVAAILNK